VRDTVIRLVGQRGDPSVEREGSTGGGGREVPRALADEIIFVVS